MQLFVNHFIAHANAFSNILINSLPLAKLCKLAVLNQRNRALIKMLKRFGPSMEPCGLPESNSLKNVAYMRANNISCKFY